MIMRNIYTQKFEFLTVLKFQLILMRFSNYRLSVEKQLYHMSIPTLFLYSNEKEK